MRVSSMIFLVAASLFSVQWVAADTNIVAPRYVVNLDLAPENRYNHILPDFKDAYAPLVEWLDTIYPAAIQPYLDPVLGNLAKFFGEEYSGELQGIADITTDWGIDLGKLVGLNLIYELTEGCTSIVAQADDGSILHGRNLDYSIPGLQDITLVADFQSNNKTQYTGTVYLGYVGLLTGMRKGSFAVTVNQRNEDHELKNLVNLILNGYKSVGMFLRTQLNTDQNYNDAIGVLQRTPLAAPVYLTVSGVKSNEGMVITRGWDGPDDVWPMASPKEYFRCQTNDDHWEPANDKRRAACNDGMGQYTRNNINATLIFEQLSEAPVFNDATIYTTIMCAATGEQYTLVRNL